jgi:hypothetical protein
MYDPLRTEESHDLLLLGMILNDECTREKIGALMGMVRVQK